MSLHQVRLPLEITSLAEHSHLPQLDIFKENIVLNGVVRYNALASKQERYSQFTYDILIIDDRKHYHKRHIVVTLKKGNEAIGFSDTASSFLSASYSSKCFGSNCEVVRSTRHLHTHELTHRVPSREIRLDAPNNGVHAARINATYATSPVSEALPRVNHILHHLYDAANKNRLRHAHAYTPGYAAAYM